MSLETIAPINEEENMKRVMGGWGNGPFYKTMNMPPSMSIVDGWPDGVREKLATGGKVPTGTPQDSWSQRR